MTDRVWFSRLLQHLARKGSESILTTLEPARGRIIVSKSYCANDKHMHKTNSQQRTTWTNLCLQVKPVSRSVDC